MDSVKEVVKEITTRLGKLFSAELGIRLQKGGSAEIFKWFVASLLFGARISETIAKNTYREFERDDLLDPEKILKRGWEGLVFTLDKGGYVRYDYKTADKFLEVMGNLKKEYNGDLNLLHDKSAGARDLEERLKNLGKGIGDVTVNIFLRELRGVWKKNRVKGYGFPNFETALLRIGKDYCRRKKCSNCPAKKLCETVKKQ